ncbi:hypothetical protein Q8W37_05255 [Shimia thalassica]|uniref:hypothetical protein n=1 Tax=Shimia thalassica TaxID=1715693 RepID=UPI002736AB30|nr:hypothetical protein [Shimia thalassica]MDP2579331.1 hypothetical protein [Shimia thalassica]
MKTVRSMFPSKMGLGFTAFCGPVDDALDDPSAASCRPQESPPPICNLITDCSELSINFQMIRSANH